MFTKKMMIASLLLGLFATGLIAKESDYTTATGPELTLQKKDLDVISKAISKNFKSLKTADKKLLTKYLQDYVNSAKKLIIPVKPEIINKPKKLGTKS